MTQYKPDGKIAYLGVQGLSAWLLFAKAADECGADVTRDCVWEKAQAITDWTGGGLHATQTCGPRRRATARRSSRSRTRGSNSPTATRPTTASTTVTRRTSIALKGDYGHGATCPNPAYASDPKPSTCAAG